MPSAKTEFWFNINPMTYHPGQLHRVLAHARLAEELGFEAATMPEHVLLGSADGEADDGTFTTLRDLRKSRPVHTPRNTPWTEGLAMAAAVAGATTRIKVVTSALIAPLRPAGLLAKSAATIDQISGGRLALGVTASWSEAEYKALGVDFASRGQRLTDTIAACRELWSATPASFESETIRFSDIYCEPKPVQAGGPPVYFTGPANARNVRRIATLGNGWLAWQRAEDNHASSVARIKDAVHEAGRNPDELVFAVNVRWLDKNGEPVHFTQHADVQRSFDTVEPYVAAGMTAIQFGTHVFADDADEVEQFLHLVASERELRGF